jgi:threonine dehydrogenase-like Zn-dependent dehydrogenase
VQALVTRPGVAGSTRVAEVPAPRAAPGEVLVRTLEVGVCGTDREIAAGHFGVAPEDGEELVVGHELLGVVLEGGGGFAPGDLVTATVRRSCGACEACLAGAPDACTTGRYSERGITRLHGWAREVVAERPEHLVAIPPSLGPLGVLAEPASICARGLRHARAVGERQPWRAERALVLGSGAIGMLTTYLLRLADVEVWTVSLDPAGSPAAELVAASGARYRAGSGSAVRDLRAEVGGFDLVVEATGDAEAMVGAVAMLRRNGVACLLGIDGRPRRVAVDGRLVGVDMILENRAVIGSVNANRADWLAAVGALDGARRRWPEALGRMVGLRVPLDRWGDAFAHRGVKATLRLSAM